MPRRSWRRPRCAAFSAALLLASAASAEARTVVDVGWTADAGGTTTVAVTVDGGLAPGDVRSYLVPEPPRAVLVIRGIAEPFEPRTLALGDRYVLRIRSGLHRDRNGPELHVVFDLADASVGILETSVRGDVVRVLLGPPPGSVEVEPPPPMPVPPTSTPTPSRTPGALPIPSPSPAVAAVVVPSPVLALDPGPATRVTEISASARGDGSTLLLVTADGRLPEGCARVIEVADEPARIVVTLRGLSAPDLPRTIEIGDDILERVRLVHDAETSRGELHLVLHLIDGAVAVTDLNQVGERIVVRLARPAADGSSP